MVALYCSSEHQEADLEKHKPRCLGTHEARLGRIVMRDKVMEDNGSLANNRLFLRGGWRYTTGERRDFYLGTLRRFRRAFPKIHTRQALEHELSIICNW